MATRLAARYVSCRFSSGGNILGEQKKAAENVLSKGQNAEATSASLGRGYAKTKGFTAGAPTAKKKKKISYAVVSDVAAVLVGVGCLCWSKKLKTQETA